MIDKTNKRKLDSLSKFKYNVSYLRFVKKGRYFEKTTIRISRITKGMASHQEWGVKTR